jgi:hypothetical protein
MHAMSVRHTFHIYRVSGCPGRSTTCRRARSGALHCDSYRLASLFESALESHEKNHETSLERAKGQLFHAIPPGVIAIPQESYAVLGGLAKITNLSDHGRKGSVSLVVLVLLCPLLPFLMLPITPHDLWVKVSPFGTGWCGFSVKQVLCILKAKRVN